LFTGIGLDVVSSGSEIRGDMNNTQVNKIEILREDIITLSCFFMRKAFYSRVAMILEMIA